MTSFPLTLIHIYQYYQIIPIKKPYFVVMATYFYPSFLYTHDMKSITKKKEGYYDT